MKKLWVFAIASAVLLTGCASGQSKNESGAASGVDSVPAITEIASEDLTIAEGETQPPERLTLPPEIRISLTTEMTASAGFLTRGGYTWSYEDENGNMQNIDTTIWSDFPYDHDAVYVTFNPDELINPPQIILPKGTEITGVKCWNGNRSQTVDFGENGNILLPAEPIGDIYCVTIEFPEGWGSYGEYGTCNYIFHTSDKVSCYFPSNGAGSEGSVPPVTAQSSAGYNPEEVVQHPGMIISDPPHYTKAPPELSMSVFTATEDLMFPVSMNAFTWTYVDDYGNGTTTCVDCPAPYQMDLKSLFDVASAEKARLELTDGARLGGVTNWSSEGERIEVDFQSTGEIYFLESPIGDIYSLEVEFPEGNCTYVFAASHDLCGYPKFEYFYEPMPGGEPVMTPPCTIYRVHDFNDSRMYPEVIVIDSIGALKRYLYENDENGSGTGFELDSMESALVDKYGRDFFLKNALVFVRIMEGSGSISHEFYGIDHENNIIIQRTQPECGTCDMAYYHVVIEIPQGMADNDFKLVTNTVYEGFDFG